MTDKPLPFSLHDKEVLWDDPEAQDWLKQFSIEQEVA